MSTDIEKRKKSLWLTSFDWRDVKLPFGSVPVAPPGGEFGPESGLLLHMDESTGEEKKKKQKTR